MHQGLGLELGLELVDALIKGSIGVDSHARGCSHTAARYGMWVLPHSAPCRQAVACRALYQSSDPIWPRTEEARVRIRYCFAKDRVRVMSSPG